MSCVAKSNDAPPCDVFPLDFAGRCFTVRVSLMRKTGETSPEMQEGEAVPTTWSAFFAGRYTQLERVKARQSHEESWANISASEKAKGDQLNSEHLRQESAERPPKRGRSVLEHFSIASEGSMDRRGMDNLPGLNGEENGDDDQPDRDMDFDDGYVEDRYATALDPDQLRSAQQQMTRDMAEMRDMMLKFMQNAAMMQPQQSHEQQHHVQQQQQQQPIANEQQQAVASEQQQQQQPPPPSL